MLKMDRINPLPLFPENMLILSLIPYKRVFRNSIQLGLGRVEMTKEST